MPSWFKLILFMTEHDKGLGTAKKLCLALSPPPPPPAKKKKLGMLHEFVCLAFLKHPQWKLHMNN